MIRSTWCRRVSLAALLGISAVGGSLAEEKVVLVAEGQPKAVIVIPAAGDSATLRMAGVGSIVLADHLLQMSGAKVPIMNDASLGDVKIDGGRLTPPAGYVDPGVDTFILLGEGELAKRLGMTNQGLGPGGIVIKTFGNVVGLSGPYDGEPRGGGTVYAVYRFLEILGCRCLWPGELGKVVPESRTIALGPLDIRYTPPIGQRRIRFADFGARNSEVGAQRLGFTAGEYRGLLVSAKKTRSTDQGWAAWNCLGGDLGILAGHAGAGLRGGWEEHGKKHPDWFALQADGTRDQSKAKERWRLCVSNLELIEYVANDIIRRVDKEPKTACISLSPNDGGYSSFCMCENCKKLDPPEAPKVPMVIFEKVGQPQRKSIEYPSLSDRYVWYWDQIAERVTKVHPKVLFVVDAYSVYSTPPVRQKLHPNLVLRYVPSTTEGWTGWQQAGAKRIYWRPNNLHSGYYLATLNRFIARQLAQNMAYLVDRGMLATDMDSIYGHWSTMGMNYYVAARTNWNPKLPYDEILEDYCRSGFGPGAEAIKKYFLRVEELSGPEPDKFTPQAVAALGDLLAAAAEAAGKDQVVCRRVAFLRAGLDFTALSAEAYRLVADAKENRPVDRAAAAKLLDQRWLLMRNTFRTYPPALNVAVIAGGDGPAWGLLGWRGPSEQTIKTAYALPDRDPWLDSDQTVPPRKTER